MVGFLNAASPKAYARELAGFLKGLGGTGYVEGSNFKIEYRWADDDLAGLPAMAADLVHREVAVIVCNQLSGCGRRKSDLDDSHRLRYRADPVKIGLTASLNRPGGNVTGISDIGVQLAGKTARAAARVAAECRALCRARQSR